MTPEFRAVETGLLGAALLSGVFELARSPSHQSALMAFASCLSIAWASTKAIGPVIIQGSCRLIASRLMKFCKTSRCGFFLFLVLTGGNGVSQTELA